MLDRRGQRSPNLQATLPRLIVAQDGRRVLYHWRTTPYQASPPRAPRTMAKGGGQPNHSEAVQAPAAMTPHHGSAVNGPLTVPDAAEAPEADLKIYPTSGEDRNAVRTKHRRDCTP